MKTIFQFAFFGLLLYPAFRAEAQAPPKNRVPSHLDLQLTPTSLIHSDPSLRLGMEYLTKNKWSYGLTGGVGLANYFYYDKRSDYTFFELRPEVKYYWFQGSDIGWKLPQDRGVYFALEGVMAKSQYTIENASHFADFEMITKFERAAVRKVKVGGLAKIGVKYLIGRKLSLDLFSGVGFARNDVRYADVVNPHNTSEDTGFRTEDFYTGKRIHPQFVLGLKLGLRLWEE